MHIARRSAMPFALLVAAGTTLAGCTFLYPGFNNPLNPDITFLNAGDVVDSVKCAVSTFLINYRAPVEREKREELVSVLNSDTITNRNYCPRNIPFGDLEKEPKDWKVAFRKWDMGKDACILNAELILQANDGKDGRSNSVTIIAVGEPTRTIEYTTADDLVAKLTYHIPNFGNGLVDSFARCRADYYQPYKYIKLVKRDERIECEPNGGCRPGTLFSERGKCDLQDSEGALAIDPDSSAKIELGLTAVNNASMNYTKIDATRLDILGGIIVPGDTAKGFPFPMFKATDKKTNKVEISVLMSQGRIREHEQKGAIEHLTKAIDNIRKATIESRIAKLNKAVRDAQEKAQALKLRKSNELLKLEEMLKFEASLKARADLQQRVHADLKKEAREYDKNCKGNALKVHFLGLANYIENIVSEQEKQIHKGSPEISLDNFVLTSSFQIAFDATAGTQHLMRIVPVLVPPTLQLNPDHTHQLKLTFKGSKGRKTKAKAVSAYRRCLDRLGNVDRNAAEKHCNSPFAIQLESLIEAVEDSKAASTAN